MSERTKTKARQPTQWKAWVAVDRKTGAYLAGYVPEGGRFGGDRFFAGELVQELHRFDMMVGLHGERPESDTPETKNTPPAS